MTPLRIGIAGLGTVGCGVVEALQRRRGGGPALEIAAVCARDRQRRRKVDLSPFRWLDDARALATEPGIDAVVEAIGGADGIALELVEAALGAGRHVVTANKALLALHGTRLAQLTDAAGVHVGYEAAVAGGIPIVKALREGLAANRIERLYGILNGTSNYVVTAMRERGLPFAEALAQAQRLGYAEADPTLDVGGGDAAHKLAVLAALAFRRPVDFAAVHIEGIDAVAPMDFAFAEEFGYRIKLLAIAQRTPAGIEQRVHPCMVPLAGPIAHVEGVFNAVVVEGDLCGPVTLVGSGAGAGPTASAVVADLIDIAGGARLPLAGVPAAALRPSPAAPISERLGACYMRLTVIDRPGVIADIAAILRDEAISVESLVQRGRAPGETVPVAMVTHEAREAAVARARRRIAGLDAVAEAPLTIRIEQL